MTNDSLFTTTFLYFISGLGADRRVFVNLEKEFPDHKHIEWEIPQKEESLAAYSQRLIDQIDLTREVILVGESFGGVIAQEIALLIPVKKLVLLSSIKNEQEMDWKLRMVSKLNLHRLFPASVLKFLNRFTADYYFSVKSREESRLLQQIINDTDPVFMTWAIDRLMHWHQRKQLPLLHIHGTSDRIFPSKYIKNAVMIKNGGHLMILDQAEEIVPVIKEYLAVPVVQ